MLTQLLAIQPLRAAEITALLDRARRYTAAPQSPAPLAGRLVATLFFENSTRTRGSFELAARHLGAEVLGFTVATSSTAKGETLEDTARTLDAMGPDIIVVRHHASGAPQFLARHLKARVVNAGDGWHEHPTQALLDAFVLRERLGTLHDKKIVIVGDVLHSRVARSGLWIFKALGARVHLAGPPSLCPRELLSLGADAVHHDLDEALTEADAVMALRLQRERMGRVYVASEGEYFARYGLREARMARAKPGALVLHPGPMNRGVEIDGPLADGPRSLVLEQVRAGVVVRMAVLAAIGETLPAKPGLPDARHLTPGD